MKLLCLLLVQSAVIAVLGFTQCGCAPSWSVSIVTRPQPSEPDGNYAEFLSAYKSARPQVPKSWNSVKEARFEKVLAMAGALKLGSPEIPALRDRFRQAMAAWRIRAERRATELRKAPPKTFVNSVGVTMKLLPSGTFLMGSDSGLRWERPVHRVDITRPFYIGVYEITGAQWARVAGGNGSDEPKTGVSWTQVAAFCRRLSEKEGVTYSLPTEAQWEYACRAGTRTEYSFGDIWDTMASYRPNPWGLYDMDRNVWEWCADWFGESYYRSSPRIDPQGPASGPCRVVRGGAWDILPTYSRAASRAGVVPEDRSSGVGFRVVVEGVE